ncbi:hypothetical protein LINPERHAP2_LOCUS14874, partial [Linum perenne]
LPFFGEVLDISLIGSRGRDAIFIKGLVKIDLLASFLGRRQACGPNNVPFWVRLHYENISSICYRCGHLGHSFSRCPNTHNPLDHEARGSWMSIGRMGFRIVKNSLQKFMQNQIKAKKMDSEKSYFGQLSFVTKEKRFGYTVQSLEEEPELEDKENEIDFHAIPLTLSFGSADNLKHPKADTRTNNGKRTIASDG